MIIKTILYTYHNLLHYLLLIHSKIRSKSFFKKNILPLVETYDTSHYNAINHSLLQHLMLFHHLQVRNSIDAPPPRIKLMVNAIEFSLHKHVF